eukprot:02605.XXX_63495_62755_1 [CDS] Oithona nana genome sequencing.
MEEMKTAFEKKGQKWDERDEEIFKEVDKNGDGKIAIEEWLKRFKDEVEEEILKELKKYKENLKAEMLKEFQALDENGDGFLTKDEIKSALKINEDKWGCFDEHYFTCLDENDDGKLSFEEWVDMSLADMDCLEMSLRETLFEYDTNGDGFLTKEEMKLVYKKTGRKWETVDDAMFQQMDEDGNGKISIDEYLKFVDKDSSDDDDSD